MYLSVPCAYFVGYLGWIWLLGDVEYPLSASRHILLLLRLLVTLDLVIRQVTRRNELRLSA